MCALNIVTTALICMLMLTIIWFCKGLTWKRDKASAIGFGLMEITYLLSLVCMWS